MDTRNIKLSPKQAKILEFIEHQISHAGRPPTLREIAHYFQYSAVGTVQDHIQALIKKGYLEKDEGSACGIRLTYRSKSVTVPILGMVPAGKPIEAIESSSGSLTVPSRYRGDLYALKVQGESMIEAGIFDGDYVVVRKQSDAEDGEIVVAMIDGEATVKYLEKKRGRLRLLPANSKFKPIELESGRDNRIQGKVVSVQRYL